MKPKISITSKVLLIVAAGLLAYSITVPIWQIDLDAPQYPEGLNMKIFADNLGGDVDIINGLNHYIGMKTLHANDFPEFSFLKYIILFFAGLSLTTAIAGRKKLLYFLFSLFLVFGVVAMIDFWRWEYNYGHDLNPHAAIIVPGMAYQPPLIGFKQLLNFGAYSVPDIGGWLFISSGGLMLIALVIESNIMQKFKHKKKSKVSEEKKIMVTLFLFAISLSSCTSQGPQPININKDNCDFCGMTISDKRFACEIITSKGRVYKFDDISCILGYKKENSTNASTHESNYYVTDFTNSNQLVPAQELNYIEGGDISSPMGGNIMAFTNKDSATAYMKDFSAEATTWEKINE